MLVCPKGEARARHWGWQAHFAMVTYIQPTQIPGKGGIGPNGGKPGGNGGIGPKGGKPPKGGMGPKGGIGPKGGKPGNGGIGPGQANGPPTGGSAPQAPKDTPSPPTRLLQST